MASNPAITCLTCNQHRDCALHRGARRPAHAARAWLLKHCPLRDPQTPHAPRCDLHAQAGTLLAPHVESKE